MPRTSSKKVGALVTLGRRRTPGLGIIIKVSETPTRGMSDAEKKELFDPPLDWEALHSYEHVALVKWVNKPSDYSMLSIYKETAWYPLSWLKVLAKITH